MKTTLFDQVKTALQLPVIVFAYLALGSVLLGSVEGAWRIPAVLIMAFFLPVLVSSVVQFYWQLCQPAWRRITKTA